VTAGETTNGVVFKRLYEIRRCGHRVFAKKVFKGNGRAHFINSFSI
jgi:hypothetical protein